MLIGFTAIALSGCLSEKVIEGQYVTINDNNPISAIQTSPDGSIIETAIGSTTNLLKLDNIEKRFIFPSTSGDLQISGSPKLISGVLSLQALKGVNDTDLTIYFDDKTLTLASKIKVETYYTNNTKKYVNNYHDVAITDGTVNYVLTNLSQDEKLTVRAIIGNGNSKTEMVALTTVKLRPDLTIQDVQYPASAKSKTEFDVGINITDLNKDSGSNFTLSINEGNNTLSSTLLAIGSGSNQTFSIPLNITQLGLHNLSVLITDSDPAESSTLNNRYDFTVEIVRGVIIIEDGISLQALKGITNTDLYVIFKDGTTSFANNIVVDAHSPDGTKISTNSYDNVEITGGTTNLILTDLNRNDRITITVTIEDGKTVYEMTADATVKLRPDLTLQSIESPSSTLMGYFDVGINVAELNNDFGSNFTLSIKESGNTLTSTTGYVSEGGTVAVTVPLQLLQTGFHTLTAVITNLDTSEYSTANNQFEFTVEITKPSISLVGYTSRYYSQNDNYYSSKDTTVESHKEVSQHMENTISENFKYVATINSELIFPIDYLYFRISNESGMVEEHEFTNIEPTSFASGKTISTIYYNDTGSMVTITSSSGLTEVKIIKTTKYHNLTSTGYDYYSSTVNTSWSTSSEYQTGTLMTSREKTIVYFEIIDDGFGYGGNSILDITVPEYSNKAWSNSGVTGYRNIETYYSIKTGTTLG